jgi:polyisoprenoid-binding protein YceI
MKLFYAVWCCVIVSLSTIALWQPGDAISQELFNIDPQHSSITFRVKQFGITWIHGRFNQVSGNYSLLSTPDREAEIDIRVRVANIDSGDVERDQYLRGPEFFHAEAYPWIIFKSTSIEQVGSEAFTVIGNLSFHGVTRRIQIDANQTGLLDDPKGDRRSGFYAVFTIRRSDYGMKYLLGGMGDRVELTVGVEGVLRKKLILTPPVFDDK